MNLNKVILIGRIGSDIRFFQTPQGVSYIRTNIVINRRTTGSKEIADYIPIIAWRTTADFINSYMKKGDLVSVEGTLQSSQYTDKNQQIVRSLDVVVDSINSLETREVRELRRQKNGQSTTQFSYGNNYQSSKTQTSAFSSQPSQMFGNSSKEDLDDDQNSWQSIEPDAIKGFRLPDEEDDID